MYYLCEKYYKPFTVQYYIANSVSGGPRLTLLDLRTNWTYECTLGMEHVRMQGTDCISGFTFFGILLAEEFASQALILLQDLGHLVATVVFLQCHCALLLECLYDII